MTNIVLVISCEPMYEGHLVAGVFASEILMGDMTGVDISPLITNPTLTEWNYSLFVKTVNGILNIQVRYFLDRLFQENTYIDIYNNDSSQRIERQRVNLTFVPKTVDLNADGQLFVRRY